MRYLQVNQFAAHDLKVDKLTNLNQVLRLIPLSAQITETQPRYLLPGTELYLVDENENLRLVGANYDTSD